MKKKPTNYDLIINKTVDEMVAHIYAGVSGCNSCPCDKHDYTECYDNNNDCIKTIKS